jgi:hypothetical protein
MHSLFGFQIILLLKFLVFSSVVSVFTSKMLQTYALFFTCATKTTNITHFRYQKAGFSDKLMLQKPQKWHKRKTAGTKSQYLPEHDIGDRTIIWKFCNFCARPRASDLGRSACRELLGLINK